MHFREMNVSRWQVNVDRDLATRNIRQLMSKIAHPTTMLRLPTDHFVNIKIRQEILFL